MAWLDKALSAAVIAAELPSTPLRWEAADLDSASEDPVLVASFEVAFILVARLGHYDFRLLWCLGLLHVESLWCHSLALHLAWVHHLRWHLLLHHLRWHLLLHHLGWHLLLHHLRRHLLVDHGNRGVLLGWHLRRHENTLLLVAAIIVGWMNICYHRLHYHWLLRHHLNRLCLHWLRCLYCELTFLSCGACYGRQHNRHRLTNGYVLPSFGSFIF